MAFQSLTVCCTVSCIPPQTLRNQGKHKSIQSLSGQMRVRIRGLVRRGSQIINQHMGFSHLDRLFCLSLTPTASIFTSTQMCFIHPYRKLIFKTSIAVSPISNCLIHKILLKVFSPSGDHPFSPRLGYRLTGQHFGQTELSKTVI